MGGGRQNCRRKSPRLLYSGDEKPDLRRIGRGAWKDRRGGDSRRKAPAAAKKPVQIRPKPSLDELVLKFVLAAFVYYPELIPEYEEKMSFFDFNNQRMHTMFDKMVVSAPKTEQTTCGHV